MTPFDSTLVDQWGLLVLVTYFKEKQHKQIETYVKEGDDEDLWQHLSSVKGLKSWYIENYPEPVLNLCLITSKAIMGWEPK